MIDFELPREIGELQTELERFAHSDLRPKMREFEAAGHWDDAAIKNLDAFAVPALNVPEAWTGVGIGELAKSVALEAVAAGDAGGLLLADPIGVSIGAALASPDTSASGNIVASCLARETTCWIAFGDRAKLDWFPSRNSAPPSWTWLSNGRKLQLLDTSNCIATPVEGAAFHASGGSSLELAGAATLREWELSDEDAVGVRGRSRLWAASVLIGIARASFEYSKTYAQERIVMGKPVAHHQANAFAIAEAAATIEAARASVRAAAQRIDDESSFAGFWATLSYLDAVDAALSATDLGVMLLGGHGYIEDHPSEKWFREARALSLMFGGVDAALDDAETLVMLAPDPMLGA